MTVQVLIVHEKSLIASRRRDTRHDSKRAAYGDTDLEISR